MAERYPETGLKDLTVHQTPVFSKNKLLLLKAKAMMEVCGLRLPYIFGTMKEPYAIMANVC